MVTTERIIRAPAAEPSNWLTYYGSYSAQRFSRLHQIDTADAMHLREAWRISLPASHPFEATPLVADGVMYFTAGDRAAVHAVDARTGRELWRHEETLPENLPACCGRVNRGVALGDGKVFFVTLDARLIALDARTGEPVWRRRLAEYNRGYTATNAPLFLKDKVIAGISGGEYGVRGFVDAYDARTGRRIWRFWTIPAPGEPGSESWGGGQAWATGGGPTWVTGSYDPDLDLLYWPVGNPAPDYNGDVRPGDNLYTDAVVALHPGDGRLAWYFQYTPHDVWDYDGMGEIVLADLSVGGSSTKALIHADKNGYFYVLDRRSGRFITAAPFARVTWARALDPRTGRPIVNPAALISSALEPVCPGPAGAKGWNHMAYSPVTRMAYIPVVERCSKFRVGEASYRAGEPFWGGSPDPAGVSHGRLLAVDAVSGNEVWAIRTERPVRSGVLATAGGLVFWGESDGTLHATNARTGKDVWSYRAPIGMYAPPMTYAVDGKQYVAFPLSAGGRTENPAAGSRDDARGQLLLVLTLP